MIAFLVVSDEPTNGETLGEYGLRFDIERCASSMKNRAAISSTPVNSRRPKRLSRLMLILAIATLHLTSIGVGVVHAEKRRFVDPHWERRLSYLKIGWRWRQQQSQRAWQAFAPFWLDPAPDPFPILVSRRAAVGERNGLDLPMAV